MQLILPALMLMILVASSCKDKSQPAQKWTALPEVTSIDSLKQTAFVPTLESPASQQINTIYAASFLYAWEKVRQTLGAPVVLNEGNSTEFKLVDQSVSHKNSLTNEEYTAESEIADSMVIVISFFNKTLPFPAKLQKYGAPVRFGDTKVATFGMEWYDPDAATFTEILYYKDDDHFILRLTPRDTLHEIRLIKGLAGVSTLSDAIQKTDSLIAAGKKERNDNPSSWKYSLNENDQFAIPVIQFNVEANYPAIEGQTFSSGGRRHYVNVASQRTGFILNENGAVIESEAKVALDSAAPEPVKILPKKMIFDKPFFIVIKRAKSENPYFVMHVQNSELLTRE